MSTEDIENTTSNPNPTHGIKIIPIIGQYFNEKLALVILSIEDYHDVHVIVKSESECRDISILCIEKNSFTQVIIPELKMGQTYTIQIMTLYRFIHHIPIVIRIPDVFSKFNVFNCDYHKNIIEADLWKYVDVDTTIPSFHIGDQVYMDHVFMTLCRLKKKELIKSVIDKAVFNEYFDCFLRKQNVLSGSFNIFLMDDHDVCDDSDRTRRYNNNAPLLVEYISSIASDLLHKLRVPGSDKDIVSYSGNKFLLIDNLKVNAKKEYVSILISKLKKISVNDLSHLFIMSPRVLMNTYTSPFSFAGFIRKIRGIKTSFFDYSTLYDLLLSVQKLETSIFMGDHHMSSLDILSDSESGSKVNFYRVGTMSSVMMANGSLVYSNTKGSKLKYDFQPIEINHNLHSYITISTDGNTEVKFNYEKKCFIRNAFVYFINVIVFLFRYAVKYH